MSRTARWVASAAILGSGLFAGVNTAAASADSISINRLPDSTELQGNVTVTDQDPYCDPTFEYCGWYGEASAYPVSVSNAEEGHLCPDVYDPTRGIWVGNTIDDPSATDRESFAFAPPASSGPIEICLYTSDFTGDAFDTSTFFAVTKARGSASLFVESVYRCRVTLAAFVNGGTVGGGNLLYEVKRSGHKPFFEKWPVSDSTYWFQWGDGSYTISVRFLGDALVNPSSWTSVSTRIRACSKYR